MQKKLSNIIRKAAFFMIPIASAICYAGISDDVYASSETTEDSLIYNFRDAKKEGTITFVKRWKDGKKGRRPKHSKYRDKYEKAEKKCQRIYCYISRKWDDVC